MVASGGLERERVVVWVVIREPSEHWIGIGIGIGIEIGLGIIEVGYAAAQGKARASIAKCLRNDGVWTVAMAACELRDVLRGPKQCHAERYVGEWEVSGHALEAEGNPASSAAGVIEQCLLGCVGGLTLNEAHDALVETGGSALEAGGAHRLAAVV